MENILGEKYFSIEHFDDYGLEEVSELIGLDIETLYEEQKLDNFYIGQTERGSFYMFCESSDDLQSNEVTFNHFKRLLNESMLAKYFKLTDLTMFIKTYHKFGIEIQTFINNKGNIEIALNGWEEKSTESDKFIGHSGLYSRLEFTKDGEFISQGFWA